MSRQFFVLANDHFRRRALDLVRTAPKDARVTVQAPRRTLPQNNHLWALLTEIAAQLPWHGLRLTADDYKLIFLDALKREVRMVPNLDGNGFVSLGRSSSDLSKEEMGDLITLLIQFGESHGVVFSEPEASHGPR